MLAFGSYLNIYIQCIWNETTKFNFSYMSFKLINKFIVFKEHWIPQFSPNASMISFHTIKDVPLKWFPPSWLELALPHSFSYVCIQLVTDSYAHFGDKISICSYNFFFFFWVVFLTVFFIDVFFFFGGIQEKFASMIVDAGFQKVEYENLVGGVVAIHSGLKL